MHSLHARHCAKRFMWVNSWFRLGVEHIKESLCGFN